MKSIADELPPDIASQINPEWRKNEAEYWAVRDQLLSQYQGQWVGFANGKVIASGSSPVAVLDAAEDSGENPFVVCVGKENEPTRMRRSSFAYDSSYPGEALPVVSLEFRIVRGSPGVVLSQVIADTGADASAIPWSDCQLLNLNPARGRPGRMQALPVDHRQLSSFESGYTSTAKNILAGFRQISSARNEFSGATCSIVWKCSSAVRPAKSS